jgi:hypothetical protein
VRKLQERRRNNERKQRARLLEELRAKQAADAAILENAKARQVREEPAIKARIYREAEEGRTKARTDYMKWDHNREVACRDMASMANFPFPPLPQCTKLNCPAFAKTPAPACHHNVKQFLEGSGMVSLTFLKRQMSYWHEDRFTACQEDLRPEFQRLANSLFVILHPWYEELKGKDANAAGIA